MSIISVCAICIASAIVANILKQHRPEYAMLISICSGCGVLIIICSQLAPILSMTEQLFDSSGVNTDYIKVMLKAAGICYISHFGGLICKDSGYTTAADNIELCAKVSIVLLSMPILSDLIGAIESLNSVG